MLPHYSPLKVAEMFSMLAALYPGRIDLGIGRAPGSDRETMFALQRDRRQMSPDDFPEQLAELLAYLEDDFPAEPSVRAPRGAARRRRAARGLAARLVAAERDLGGRARAAVRRSPTSSTRRAPRSRSSTASASSPSSRRAEPYVGVAVSVVCAETDEEARAPRRRARAWR